MRIPVLAAPILAAALVTAPAPAPAARATASAGWGGVSSLPSNRTSGTALYDRGTWSFTDRWADATGANVDRKHREDYFGTDTPAGVDATYDLFGTHRLARNGDYYPPTDDARFPELSADIVFAQLRPSRAGLDVRVVLTSLGQPDSAILTLGLAAAGGHATSDLPRNAGARCERCGVERWVTTWGTGGEVATAGGARLGGVTALHVDRALNAVSFRVPAAFLPRLRRTLRVWLASGLHDGHGRYLTVQPTGSSTAPGGGVAGATNVFDLAFVHERRTAVDERVQSDALAAGDIGPAAADVDLDLLRRGVHRLVGEPRSGPLERVLVSSLDEGEGIDSGNGPATFQNPGPGDNMHYSGRLQGYLVDLPPGYDPRRRYPEVVVLHGYNGFYDEIYFAAPKLRDAIRRAGAIGVYPLGRGDVQYEHDGEFDVLEVQRAVEHDYAVDTSRVHLVGISMGGFGATKLAVRHPDVFADAATFVGGEQGDVNVTNDRIADYPLTRAYASVLGNLQDTPLFLGASTADADVAGAAASLLYQRLVGIGAEAHLKQYLAGTHEPAVMDLAVPQLTALWKRSRRPAVPPRLHYGYDTSWRFGPLRDDGIAWVSGLEPSAGTQGAVDADALTLPRATSDVVESRSSGGDPTDRSSYLLRDAVRRPNGSRALANALVLTLTSTARAVVDVHPLRADLGRRYCVDVTSDAPTTLVLRGTGQDRVAGAAAVAGRGALTVRLPAGTTHLVLAPRGVAPRPGAPCPRR